MISIELYNQETEETKKYTEVFVSSRSFRKVLEFYDKTEKNLFDSTLEEIDAMIAIIADAYRDTAVTTDAIWDGIRSDQLDTILQDQLGKIMGSDGEKKRMNLEKITN